MSVVPAVFLFDGGKDENRVERSNAAYKESAGRLNTATLDRAGNAVTYRIYGCEKQRSGMYEKQLDDYEKQQSVQECRS